MPEDNFEKREGEVLSLFERRERAGTPSQEQIVSVMQKNVPLVISDIIASFTGEQNIALLEQLLEEYKSDVQKNAGISLSRPVLCATFLSINMGDQFMREAMKALDEHSMGKFRFFYDFSIGLELSLNRVHEAEMELSDVGEEERLRLVSYGGYRVNMPVEEQAQEYLDMKRENAESSRLLRKDPTGFLLMDDFVERVKVGSWDIIAWQAKEYILAGAEVARDLYKKLYGIAVPLYPQVQSK